MSVIVKNTFLTICEEPRASLRLSRTIDIGCLFEERASLCDSPMSKISQDTASTACCSSISNISVADTVDLKAAAHACGECKPCAFSMKAGGCKNDDCDHCHEEHSKDFLKFIRKRNRAMRMAQEHGDAPRCAMTYQEHLSQQRRRSC